MAASRTELILADIKTALEGVQGGAGYSNTVRHVSRDFVPPEDLHGTMLPALFVTYESEDDAEFTQEQDEGFIRIGVTAIAQAMTGLSTVLNSLIKDVHKALMADRTRSGLASDTIREGVPQVDEVSMAKVNRVGALMMYQVRYTRTIDSLE